MFNTNDNRWFVIGDWYCRHGSCYSIQCISESGRAVEVCGDVDVMILDKTGTITYGNRIASEFYQ